MRIGNVDGRAAFVLGVEADGSAAASARYVDIERASDGALGPDPGSVFDRWDDVVELGRQVAGGGEPLDPGRLGCAVPEPRQVFAIGLNYRKHAAETGAEIPSVPATFTKFPGSLSGPFDPIPVGETCDWEVELVVVIGRRAERVSRATAWDYVAGLTIGQDVSDRTMQYAAAGQFSLGKSHRGFGPIGPCVVTLDELGDPGDLELGCALDGDVLQRSRTADMAYDVPELIERLSDVVTLSPGDVIFTGTPEGVGMARTPPRFLEPGQELETWIEGLGRMRNPVVAR